MWQSLVVKPEKRMQVQRSSQQAYKALFLLASLRTQALAHDLAHLSVFYRGISPNPSPSPSSILHAGRLCVFMVHAGPLYVSDSTTRRHQRFSATLRARLSPAMGTSSLQHTHSLAQCQTADLIRSRPHCR